MFALLLHVTESSLTGYTISQHGSVRAFAVCSRGENHAASRWVEKPSPFMGRVDGVRQHG
jgi:hypothetical protein